MKPITLNGNWNATNILVYLWHLKNKKTDKNNEKYKIRELIPHIYTQISIP